MNINIIFVIIGIICFSSCNNEPNTPQIPDNLPKFEDAGFTNPTNITNPYFGPDQGGKYVYKGGPVGMEPDEEIRIEMRTTTKQVMGISCIIQNDVVFLNGIIIEDTDDWLAQDDDGNLWYFGEFVKNYSETGKFLDNDGSWEAGIDGALPGYWIPANPYVGQSYSQEYYLDEAEDQAEIIEVNKTVTIGIGTYQNCIVTKDFTPLEPEVYEKKYYAPEIGLIKVEKFENNKLVEIVELVEIIE